VPTRILAEATARGLYASENWRLRIDGTRFWATAVMHALRNARGDLIGFASVVRDATRRHELDQLKSEFVSTVSHELRTPLTSIRGSLGLLEGGVLGKLPEQAESMIKIAHQNSPRLVRIINDILDIEKIESGKLELRLQPLAIAPLLRHALEVNEGYGRRYQVRFVLQTVPEQVLVVADSDRLQQVMANLLSNAAKFSSAGAEVMVRATAAQGRVRFEVEDRGTGIPEEFQLRIFEKFAQADSSASRRFEGTGLGLSITRQLIEAMDGTIGFNTVVGQGTTFYFELPCSEPLSPAAAIPAERIPATPVTSTTAASALRGGELPKVLHLEADSDLSDVLSATLAGKAVVTAAQTLREARRLLGSEPFSLLILDPSLPDGDGLDLLAELPQRVTYRLPVVILSVAEMPQAVRQRVTAALVKSRVSEERITAIVMSALSYQPAPLRDTTP
jgi:signal transduction histidine kinase/CheY-like chemotaxis protein